MKYPYMCASGLDFVSVEMHLFACDGQISIQLMNPSFNRDGLSSSSHKIMGSMQMESCVFDIKQPC